MKFALVEKPTYWWPVTVRVPDPDTAGKFQEQELKLQFVAQPRDAAIAAQEAYADLTSDRARHETEVAQMLDIVTGWDGVVDGNGNPVPFSETTLRAALQLMWFRNAVNAAYAESMMGIEARLGN
ncbi:MAG TPA: hypothetical protein DEF16_03760 [Gemmobacter sp.]|nr:hypothetical protein [Gemmobacter sp.]HBU14046.1 hypothetical protein [Gemmobacter sp.]